MTRRTGVALALIVAVVWGGTAAAAELDKVADGFVTGREHEVRVRSVLAKVPPEAAKLKRSARTSGNEAIASCDPAQVAALRRKVPTTSRDGDDPKACVVLARSPGKNGERVLLGPAHLAGSELGRVAVVRARRGRKQVVVHLSTRGANLWTYFGPQIGDAPLAVTLDGDLLDTVPVIESSLELGGHRGYVIDEAQRLRGLLVQAEREEVIELARTASLSRPARTLFSQMNPQIREKATFIDDCPLPEADDAFVLGCYDGFTDAISILRVDRTDIASVMPVTAAHELLHAEYKRLDRRTRTKVDAMIEQFLTDTPQPAIEDELSLYTERERANEAHSLLGTEVRDLPRSLEKYYAAYFDDRAAVVTLFEGYESVFHELETKFAVLEFELAALEDQLRDLEGQANAAGNQADSLGSQIDDLRAQGRIDESNSLVGPQNAAVNRANALTAQFNAVVDQYNAKVAELNAAADSLGDLYNAVSPIPYAP